MDQLSTIGMMKKIVPITRFNKGEANKIFDEVQSTGTKIVMKNNRPACVLVSPEQYEALIERLSDYLLLAEADRRMAVNQDAENISHEDMMRSIEKTAERPLPPPEGIGKPLGSHAAANLSGYYKIKLRDLGYRVVYGLIREEKTMKVIVITIRDDEAVYREAERRIANMPK